MPVALAAFRRGMIVHAAVSSMMVFTATQSAIAELRNGGRLQRGQDGEHGGEISACAR